MARLARFEPATCGFVVRHSIQLSYRRVWRRDRDSNPRYMFCTYNRLAGDRLRPARPSLRMKKTVVAEEVGFEPTEPVKIQRFSRPPPSTARTPLHKISFQDARDSIPYGFGCVNLTLISSKDVKSGN